MKAKKLTVFLLTLILALGVLPMGALAAQRTVTPSSQASITIENALENDELSAYKVIDIAYVSATNTVNYQWNSDFADYFSGTTSYNPTAYTVDDFAALTSDSDELKDLLAQLPSYIKDRTIASVKTETVGADGKAVFDGLDMGEYFIRPTETTSVYQLMLQKLEPVAAGGVYVIDDVVISAKKEEVNIEKTADKTSVTKNETVTYTVEVDVPTYSDNATDKSFAVYDLLPDGLTIDELSITVKVDGAVVDSAAYDLDTTATPQYTFKLSVDSAKYENNNWFANGGKKLVITYKANLNNDATTEVNVKETNTATFDYSNYPYVENSHKQKTDTYDVTTFAIKIDKYVSGNEAAKLADAKFDLYRTATQAEIDAGVAESIPHTSVKGVKLEGDKVTAADGSVTFDKYEANGTNYDYYLVETAAPSGYNLLDNAVKVNFTDAEVEATAGVYTVKIANTSGIQLPITGGTGTVIFTVIGIVLMAGAVVLLIASRKRSKAKENK